MKTHSRCIQVVNIVTCGQVIVDNIWTYEVFIPPVAISELGTMTWFC